MKKLYTLALLALAACSSGSADYTPVAFDFHDRPPLRLNVAEVRVIDAYTPPLAAPNVEQDFPTPPARAAADWARARLQAAGAQGVVEVTVTNAAVKEVPLPRKKGVEGLFTDEQASRFDATLSVSIKLYKGDNAMSDASTDITVTRSSTINEKATIADRERLFDGMTRAMTTELDQQAQAKLRQYFSAYIL